ncbi:MAG: 4Fe-4S dicluster domain-containing protein [Candidatus Omnitrophota bacterium]
MPKITVDKEKCKGCLLCIKFCPRGLIKISAQFNKRGVRHVELKEGGDCLGCALCAIICPDACIEVYK